MVRAKFVFWIFILAFGGFMGVFFPRTLMGEGKRFPINVIAGILGMFPEKIQPWAARLAGLCLFLAVAWLFQGGLTEDDAPSSGYSMGDLARFQKDVGAELKGVQTRYQVKLSENSSHILLLPVEPAGAQPLVVDCFDLASLSPKDAAGRILAVADKQFGPAPTPPSGGAGPGASPLVSTPLAIPATLEAAEQALADSAKDWEAGRRQDSIEKAKLAHGVYTQLLGANHPKTVQVKGMIDSAVQLLQNSATPAVPGG